MNTIHHESLNLYLRIVGLISAFKRQVLLYDNFGTFLLFQVQTSMLVTISLSLVF